MILKSKTELSRY